MSRFIGSRSWSRNEATHNAIVAGSPPCDAIPALVPSLEVKTM
jgi:hypothetical protein